MKKDKNSKSPKIRNFVAKNSKINKGGAHRDKTKYYRKDKSNKKPDDSGFFILTYTTKSIIILHRLIKGFFNGKKIELFF